MGLGLHGGGIASVRFFAERGADVTVTDLRDRGVLAPSISALGNLPVRYVLGRHDMDDFTRADLVIKNPAVRRSSPYLAAAKKVETDISIFLRMNHRPVLAVTGSKGKSTTVSALHHILKNSYPDVLLGGNITVSPLTFVESCEQPSDSPVILELSSWQLADLVPPDILHANISLITNIMADHQNSYDSMDQYVDDKRRILAGQDAEDRAIFFYDDGYGRNLAESSRGDRFFYSANPLPPGVKGAFLTEAGGVARLNKVKKDEVTILPREISMRGEHNRLNLLMAGLIALLYGVDAGSIRRSISGFRGIEHRFEFVDEIHGIKWINDSAATIPEATAAALKSVEGPVHLITGGTDKKLSFEIFEASVHIPVSYHLLEGTATDRMIELLGRHKRRFSGPYDNLQDAVLSPRTAASPGETVLFSPGSTSFGMFLNEFDRGRRFKEIVATLKG